MIHGILWLLSLPISLGAYVLGAVWYEISDSFLFGYRKQKRYWDDT